MTISAPPVATIPDSTPDLAGKIRSNDRVFFAPLPDTIGPLYRAESTLKTGQREKPLSFRLLTASLAALPGLALALLAAKLIHEDSNGGGSLLFIGSLLMLIGAAIAWYYTRFAVSCSYVGQLGAIRYLLKGNLNNQPLAQYIEFSKATELRTAATRHYYNGVYTGTSYSHKWTDAAGRPVLTLSGRHSGNKGLPKSGDPFHFASAAEIAWSMFLLNRADNELAQTGSLRFNIDARKTVIVGPGFIEFHFGDRTDRCEAADIKSINLNQGTFSIQHRDAKWYSSKGKFSFPYGAMPNARLFLLVLDRFLPKSTWARQ